MAKENFVFQISGIKNAEEKRIIIRGIRKLGGEYISGSVYQHVSTHLIVPQVLPSEKFLAACAAGKWVVTPNYVLESVQYGTWLSEEHYEVAISTSAKSTFYPARRWRETVASGKMKGAFQGWRVLLMIQEPSRRAMFNRILKAGRANVFHDSSQAHAAFTHLMAKPISEAIKCLSSDAPCHSVSLIVQHLFGKWHLDMNFKLENCFDVDVEQELKDYIIQHNSQPRLSLCQFMTYQDTFNSQPQATDVDFTLIASMIECGLFNEALSTMEERLFPGLLPPEEYVVSLLEYAQQGNASSAFLGNFQQFLHNVLRTNPPWIGSKSVKKYYWNVLQCPCCKAGLWPLLESCICYCLLRESLCHPLPGPALFTLFQFHSNLLAFIVTLFKGELYAVSRRMKEHACEVVQGSTGSPLILATFWTVWERSTLLSSAVKRLTQLVVEAASEEEPDESEKQNFNVVDTLVDLLSAVVEFWCHHNLKLNQALVEKGLKDFAEHFAVISHKLPPRALVELVVKVRSSRVKVAIADSVFRCLCCRNGYTVGEDALCVTKIMQKYIPALEVLSQSEYPCNGQTSLVIKRENTADTGSGLESPLAEVSENGTEKSYILKGLNRVNAAGETLLHRACRRNQVETVLKILALPDCDVNVQDHAGWTPLHEACNHGSTACVQALLRHYPAPVVNSQVGGVSPLHDALLNGHMDIAKLLLEHTGSVILQQRDHQGNTPLDLVSDPVQKEKLFGWSLAGETSRKKTSMEVRNLPLLEAASFLLIVLFVAYMKETGLHVFVLRDAGPQNLRQKMLKVLKTSSFETVTSTWSDQRAVRLLGDMQTLMDMGRGSYDGALSQPIRKCRGENTQLLMEQLDELESKGKELLLLLKES